MKLLVVYPLLRSLRLRHVLEVPDRVGFGVTLEFHILDNFRF